jgi:hypothetical protein
MEKLSKTHKKESLCGKRTSKTGQRPLKKGKREEGKNGGGEEYSDSVNEDLYLGPEKV